jgi:hypothetical protein
MRRVLWFVHPFREELLEIAKLLKVLPVVPHEWEVALAELSEVHLVTLGEVEIFRALKQYRWDLQLFLAVVDVLKKPHDWVSPLRISSEDDSAKALYPCKAYREGVNRIFDAIDSDNVMAECFEILGHFVAGDLAPVNHKDAHAVTPFLALECHCCVFCQSQQ